MKIVIFVDYSSKHFNKDFDLSSMLKGRHNVFFAINIQQLDYLAPNCDLSVLGYSGEDKTYDFDLKFDLKLPSEMPVQVAAEKIEELLQSKQNTHCKNA